MIYWHITIALKKNYLFIYMAVLGLLRCACFSLVVVSGGCALVLVRGLLPVVASFVAEQGPRNSLSVAVAHGLSYSVTCGIFLGQGLNPCLRHCQADSLPVNLQGSPLVKFLSGISIAISALIWFSFAWNIFFHPFTLSLFVSLKSMGSQRVGPFWATELNWAEGAGDCFNRLRIGPRTPCD